MNDTPIPNYPAPTTTTRAGVPPRPTEGNLAQHAWDELNRQGLFDPDGDYGGMLGRAVYDLVCTFAEQGHSGCSARACVDLFRRVASFEPLSDLTTDPDEWLDVTDGLWQSRRMAAAFSQDRGRTFRINGDPTVYTSKETTP